MRERIKAANKAYFSLIRVMRSRDIHKKVTYKTLICIVWFGSLDYDIEMKIENAVDTFERKIL